MNLSNQYFHPFSYDVSWIGFFPPLRLWYLSRIETWEFIPSEISVQLPGWYPFFWRSFFFPRTLRKELEVTVGSFMVIYFRNQIRVFCASGSFPYPMLGFILPWAQGLPPFYGQIHHLPLPSARNAIRPLRIYSLQAAKNRTFFWYFSTWRIHTFKVEPPLDQLNIGVIILLKKGGIILQH